MRFYQKITLAFLALLAAALCAVGLAMTAASFSAGMASARGAARGQPPPPLRHRQKGLGDNHYSSSFWASASKLSTRKSAPAARSSSRSR